MRYLNPVLAVTVAICGMATTASGEILHLRNGSTITGRILEKTSVMYRVEISPGAIFTFPVDQVREVEEVSLARELPIVPDKPKLQEILPKPDSANVPASTFESRLEQPKSLDELIQEGKGVPRLTTPAQMDEARKRKLATVRFQNQTYYLNPEGKYQQQRSKFKSLEQLDGTEPSKANAFDVFSGVSGLSTGAATGESTMDSGMGSLPPTQGPSGAAAGMGQGAQRSNGQVQSSVGSGGTAVRTQTRGTGTSMTVNR